MDEENLYEKFLRQNNERVNRTLNKIAWLFAGAGPVITLGVLTGYFKTITIATSFYTTLLLMVVAGIHTLIVRRWPRSIISSFVVLIGIQLVMMYMAYYHIGMYVSWFVIPLVSLLYCRKKIFQLSAFMAYVVMIVTLWMIAPYQASIRIGYTPLMWFAGMAGGMSIEFVVMLLAGTFVSDLIDDLLHGSSHLLHVKERENYLDKLTGLWNKKYMEAMYNELIVNQHKNYSFFILDLDNFKEINDSYGHLNGDSLLVSLAKILKDTFQEYDHCVLSARLKTS